MTSMVFHKSRAPLTEAIDRVCHNLMLRICPISAWQTTHLDADRVIHMVKCTYPEFVTNSEWYRTPTGPVNLLGCPRTQRCPRVVQDKNLLVWPRFLKKKTKKKIALCQEAGPWCLATQTLIGTYCNVYCNFVLHNIIAEPATDAPIVPKLTYAKQSETVSIKTTPKSGPPRSSLISDRRLLHLLIREKDDGVWLSARTLIYSTGHVSRSGRVKDYFLKYMVVH